MVEIWYDFIGIWLSAFSLGNFVGPTIAGALVETEGFRNTTLIFFSLYLVMLILDTFEGLFRFIQERRQRQYQEIRWSATFRTWANI